MRAHAAELAFGGLGKAFEQGLADYEAENGIAQEFQALVVAPAGAAMGQGRLEQIRLPEMVTETPLQPLAIRPQRTGTSMDFSKLTTTSRLPSRLRRTS